MQLIGEQQMLGCNISREVADCLHLLVSPAAERLRHILGDDDSSPTPTLFTEMDTLQQEGGELEWKESAR